MRRIIGFLAILAVLGAAAFWWVTRPVTADAAVLAGIEPDLARGEQVFHAGGCAGCHAAKGAEGEDRMILSGGRAFPSDFGTFHAPNISPHPEAGIGGWSALDLYNAMHHGVSPDGAHYYPAFPYGSYVRAAPEDIVSLYAFLLTLPQSGTENMPHDVGFPFNIRRALGGWKFLYLADGWQVGGDLTEAQTRGRYLAEALGHCGECHTPRGPLGGLQAGKWLAGAPNPSGEGTIPNITPAKLDWSESDLAAYFSSGFTPEFDTAGGHMVEVIESLSRLSDADRAALAAYLKAVPPVE